MEFEYDSNKSDSNKAKHGIDFEQAKKLWLDQSALVLEAHRTEEPRFLIIGRIGDTHWTGIYTYRGDAVRLISVRRSRHKERERYENHSQ